MTKLSEFSLKTLNPSSLAIEFSEYWQYDDIQMLFDGIFSFLFKFKLLETTIGADRKSYRMIHQQHECYLHFESNSQSCWFEWQSDSLSDLPIVVKLLSSNG